MKGNGDHGSLVPLNLRLRPQVQHSPVMKSESHQSRAESAARMGTPPTRWGAFHGAIPKTQPAPVEGPALLLEVNKAVIDPAMAGSGAGDRVARKRDPHTGKFTAAPSAGPQSTAQDDLAQQERAAKLTARRLGIAGGGAKKGIEDMMGGAPQQPGGGTPQLARPKPNPMQQAGVSAGPPGQSGVQNAMSAAANADGGATGPMPIGMTPEGQPIFADPYNPAHANFTPDQHRAAADLHNQQAEMATNTGRIPTALDHQLKARIHMDLANEARSPMERMLATSAMPGSAGMQETAAGTPNMHPTGGGTQDPMDDFLSQLSAKDPGAKNADQNKPLVPGGAAVQGPKPGMFDTTTGGPVGPQSQQASHAGTVEQPQEMPADPAPGNGSMPEIEGPQPTPTDALDWDPSAFEIDDEGGAGGDDGDEDGADDGGGFPPASNAGAPSENGPDKDVKPAPGSAESSPPTEGAGPSVKDNSPFAKRAEAESAEKSFNNWFSSL